VQRLGKRGVTDIEKADATLHTVELNRMCVCVCVCVCVCQGHVCVWTLLSSVY